MLSDAYDVRQMYKDRLVETILSALEAVKTFQVIGDIEESIHEHRQAIVDLAVDILGQPGACEVDHVPKGLSVMLMIYLSAATADDVHFLSDLLDQHSFDPQRFNKGNVRMLMQYAVGS